MMRHLKHLFACLLIPALVAVGTLVPSQEANAALATTLLNPDPSVTQLLEDDDYESIQDAGGNPNLLEPGDILYGMQVIQTVYSNALSGPLAFTGETFTAVFAAEVLAAGGGNPGPNETLNPFALGPVSPATFATLTGVTPTGANTIAIAYSDPFTNVPVDAIDAFTPLTTQLALATATDGTPLWEFGFTGAAGEGFFIRTNEIDLDDVTSDDIVSFFAGLNVTHQYADGIPLGLVDEILGLGPSQLQFLGVVDTLMPVGTNFDFRTDTNFFINAVPEPSTNMALAGILGMGVVGLVIRRRK